MKYRVINIQEANFPKILNSGQPMYVLLNILVLLTLIGI